MLSGLRKYRVVSSLSALAFMVLFSSISKAQSVTLPDTGVDVASLIMAGITKLGVVAAVAVGGAIAFMVVRKAISWARTMS